MEEVLRPGATLVFKVSREARWEDAGVGEWAREELNDGRGDEMVDIVRILL